MSFSRIMGLSDLRTAPITNCKQMPEKRGLQTAFWRPFFVYDTEVAYKFSANMRDWSVNIAINSAVLTI